MALNRGWCNADELWKFSVDFYLTPGLEERCLSLQERYRANVNLIILLVYCDINGLIPQLDPLLQVLNHSEGNLHLYRQMRRRMKARLCPTHHKVLLEHELTLERRQQAALIEAVVPERRFIANSRAQGVFTERRKQLSQWLRYRPTRGPLRRWPLLCYLSSLGVEEHEALALLSQFHQVGLSAVKRGSPAPANVAKIIRPPQ